MEKNIIVAVFKVESEGYQALSQLRQEAGSDSYLVSAAALVKKENGVTRYLDGFDTGARSTDDTAIGGLVGMTVGILGGPIGMLLGAELGALIGANVDAGDALFDSAMLEQIAEKLDDGSVAMIALAAEENDVVVDSKFADFDVVIARFNADAVAKEVNKAAEMQVEMARQAKEELRRQEKEEFRQKIEDKKEEARRITEENKKLINDEFHFDEK
ncbi:MAG: DUF1269 domain-containing protein [Eubacterium sp.]|nr:DUF1269 domain-containing protein [Eubacterium sp.]